MIPEEKAALIVWRIMVPSVPFEEFERHLLRDGQSGTRPWA